VEFDGAPYFRFRRRNRRSLAMSQELKTTSGIRTGATISWHACHAAGKAGKRRHVTAVLANTSCDVCARTISTMPHCAYVSCQPCKCCDVSLTSWPGTALAELATRIEQGRII
jgi:hypothetical protein